MDSSLVIEIDWPYFLGIMGALIGIAWYTSARFTKIEVLIENLDKRISSLEDRITLIESALSELILKLKKKGVI